MTTWWEGADRYTKVIGATEDTGWSPPVVNPFSGEEVEAELEQNDGLEMYRTSAAALAANTETGAVDALSNDASMSTACSPPTGRDSPRLVQPMP